MHTVINSFKQYNYMYLSTRNSERPSKVIICLFSSKNFDRRKRCYSTCRIEAVTCCSSVVSVSGESNIFEIWSIGLSLDCLKYGGISLRDICFPFDKITSNRWISFTYEVKFVDEGYHARIISLVNTLNSTETREV